MNEAKAFSPCHITGFFQICDEERDPLHIGSRGAGISLEIGVKTTVKIAEARSNSVEIRINHIPSESAEVSERVLSNMLLKLNQTRHTSISIEHETSAPIGAGFGTSGAAALSLALALNEALGIGLRPVEAAQVAHVAEVRCRTGLGTVIAEVLGGLEIRVKAGAPGVGEVKQLQVPRNLVVVCLVFGSLSTRKSLMDPQTRKRINELGGDLVNRLTQGLEASRFMELSREFAENVGLISGSVREVLSATDAAGLECSMPMFGDAVFALVEPESLDKIKTIYERFPKGQIVTSQIDFEGARLLS